MRQSTVLSTRVDVAARALAEAAAAAAGVTVSEWLRLAVGNAVREQLGAVLQRRGPDGDEAQGER